VRHTGHVAKLQESKTKKFAPFFGFATFRVTGDKLGERENGEKERERNKEREKFGFWGIKCVMTSQFQRVPFLWVKAARHLDNVKLLPT
jgi:hypothetical protein